MFENGYGSLPQFGGGSMYPGGPMSADGGMGMGGGEGMFGQAPAKKKKKKGGFDPLMLLSPFGALMSQNPNMAMTMMSPLAGLLGAFK